MLNNLPPRTKAVLNNYLVPLVDRTSPEMLLLGHLTFLSRMFSWNRVTIRTSFREDFYPTLFSFCFIHSGGGKNKMMEWLEKPYGFLIEGGETKGKMRDASDEYREVREAELYDKYTTKGHSPAQAKAHMKENSPYALKNRQPKATPEGFASIRAEMSYAGIGSTYFENAEFVDYLSNNDGTQGELLDSIKEAYETGAGTIKVIKREKEYREIYNTPQTFFALSAIHGLGGDSKTYALFKTLFQRGWARRSTICSPQSKPDTKSTREEKRKAKEFLLTIEGWLIEACNWTEQLEVLEERETFEVTFGDEPITQIKKTYKPRVIELTEELDVYFEDRVDEHVDMADLIRTKTNDIPASHMQDMPWREIRIAALLALFEHPKRLEIGMEEYKAAEAIVAHYAEDFNRVMNVARVTNGEKIYDFIKDMNKQKIQVTKSLLKGQPFVQQGRGWYEQAKIDIEEICDERGEMLIDDKQKNKSDLKIQTIDDIAVEGKLPDAVFSYSDQTGLGGNQHPSLGFKKKVIPFDRLHEMLTVYPYATHPFKEGHRSNDDAVCEGNIMIVDIDNKDGAETLSMDEAKERFKDYACLIMPSKNHQKDKALEGGGVSSARDRFRIIFLYSEPIDIPDHKQYMETVLNCWKMMGLYDPSSSKEPMVDVALAKKSQYSRCSPLVPLPWYSEGKKIINWKPFLASKLPKKTYVKQERHNNDDDDVKAIPIRQLVEACGKTLTKERGDSQWFDCPFHNSDKKVAFLVTTSKNIWHCFNCLGPEGKSSGGSSVDFVMQKFGWSNDTVGKAKAYSVLKNYLQTGNLEEV